MGLLVSSAGRQQRGKCRRRNLTPAALPASEGRSEAERECREKAARVLPASIFWDKEMGGGSQPPL